MYIRNVSSYHTPNVRVNDECKIESMNVRTIYEQYMIPQNLQEHMLRVASLADIILTNWTGLQIDKEAIITTCLFHDIAKPMSFNLAKQAAFGMNSTDILRLKKLQEFLKSEFGEDEHRATVKIYEKLNVRPKVIALIDNLEWSNISKLLKNNDTESLMPIYCDMRIGPNGILSLNDRLYDLKVRTNQNDYEKNVANGTDTEKMIQQNCAINIDSVNDQQIQKRFETLLNYRFN